MSRSIHVIANHRTGSSALAGVLHKLGCNMGYKLLGKTHSNKKGHFEDINFLKHNDSVISDWKQPFMLANEEQIEQYQRLVEIKEKYWELWGIKDPRMCITAKYILPFCDQPKILTIVRSPNAVIRSFVKRDNLSFEYAKDIYLKYEIEKRNIFRRFRTFPFLSITYEELLEYKGETINKLINFIFDESNLPSEFQVKESISFIDKRLNHNGY